jgi:hypothetical protein
MLVGMGAGAGGWLLSRSSPPPTVGLTTAATPPVNSSTKITAESPAGTSTVDVSVTTEGVTSSAPTGLPTTTSAVTNDMTFNVQALVPRLLAPENGAVLPVSPNGTHKMTFSWHNPPSAVKFHLETQWQDPTNGTWQGGLSVEVAKTTAETTYYMYESPDPYPVRWRVVAVTAEGTRSAPSDWWTFRYSDTPTVTTLHILPSSILPAPRLLAPKNGAVLPFPPGEWRTTTLSWRAVGSATSYLVEWQWQDPADPSWALGESVTVSGTTYTFDFIGATTGRWRASALNGAGGSSAPSGWWTFEYTQ